MWPFIKCIENDLVNRKASAKEKTCGNAIFTFINYKMVKFRK